MMRPRLTRTLPRLRAVPALVVLALIASGCSLLGDSGGYQVDAQFARTYNLFAGSPVRALGVDIGTVKDITTSPDSDVVTVELLIDDDVSLPADVKAVIVPASILGERYVQLDPPFVDGPTLDAGATIPIERTIVPSEFDEILESLNRFVGEIDASEFGRFVTNLADTLDGNGEELGQTIESARAAVGVLRDNDEEIIALASRLSDLNEILNSRDQQIGQLIQDFNTLTRSLADDRGDLDAALSGLVRISNQLATLLEDHRPDLEQDIETLTRVGRTAQRNLDEFSRSLLWQAELFRHAQRGVNTTKNWLPLVDHAGGLGSVIAESLAARLEGACLAAGLPADQCEQLGTVGEVVPDNLCLPPLVPCPDGTGAGEPTVPTVGEVLRDAIEAVPELADALGGVAPSTESDPGTSDADPGTSDADPGASDADADDASDEQEVAR